MTVATEQLHRDVHPAEVLMPNGEVVLGRVFVTAHRMVIWTEQAGTVTPTVDVALEQPCSVPRDRGSLFGALEVRLADGSTAWVNRGRGCGCGSPLKALAAPFTW